MSVSSLDATIQKLIRAPVSEMSDTKALQCVAALIDFAGEADSSAGIKRAFSMLSEIEQRKLGPADQALIHYFRANAWANKHRNEPQSGSNPWERTDWQEQILSLSLACNHHGFGKLDKVRQCQILTNLGIRLNEVGRFIEGIELWDKALALMPNFAMAHGSRGSGFQSYGRACEDGYHFEMLMFAAHGAFAAATADGVFWDSDYSANVAEGFRLQACHIAEWLDMTSITADLDLDGASLGRSHEEKSYRRWCLARRLFLNPLNDLGAHDVAACDPLMLPSLRTGIEVPGIPPIIGLYNQMKQEYAFARLLLYEGQPEDSVHFADRRVLLHNTLDYPSFSIATEKLRTSFRLAYSILDKVGYFINIYWKLGRAPHRVGFRSVWYDDPPGERRLNSRFETYDNWPLRGLFWLSKDLFDERLQRVTNPDAREIFIIRNHLEHKYLQVHYERMGLSDAATAGIGHSIEIMDFAAKALRLLKIARAAMIYLSLAVHAEERHRWRDVKYVFIMEMGLTTLKDSWKR
jgi:tetratricopeptide (TPR) repeat protein